MQVNKKHPLYYCVPYKRHLTHQFVRVFGQTNPRLGVDEIPDVDGEKVKL